MILLFVMPEFTNLSIYHHAIHQSLTCMPIPARVEPSSTMMISMPIPIKEDKARRLETQASRYGAALYTGMITESVINNSTFSKFTNLSIYHHAIHKSLTSMPIPASIAIKEASKEDISTEEIDNRAYIKWAVGV